MPFFKSTQKSRYFFFEGSVGCGLKHCKKFLGKVSEVSLSVCNVLFILEDIIDIEKLSDLC